MPDQLATLKTLLTFAERIEHPTEAPQVMARAFQAMLSGRRRDAVGHVPATADVAPTEPLGKRANPAPDPDKIAALACSPGFSGTLGYGFPTAPGVKVANPNCSVVSVTGDDGFLFGGSDLAARPAAS